jgi:GntR family transcriptional regulator
MLHAFPYEDSGQRFAPHERQRGEEQDKHIHCCLMLALLTPAWLQMIFAWESWLFLLGMDVAVIVAVYTLFSWSLWPETDQPKQDHPLDYERLQAPYLEQEWGAGGQEGTLSAAPWHASIVTYNAHDLCPPISACALCNGDSSTKGEAFSSHLMKWGRLHAAVVMIEFHLDDRSGVPPYLQIVQQVKQAMRLGLLSVGDRLPTVREVVERLVINPNTVLKAYRELEHEGLVVSRPGQGTFIVRTLTPVSPKYYTVLRHSLVRWLESAREAGLDDESILALFNTTLRETRTVEGEGTA